MSMSRIDPPAMVRSAVDLAALAAQINAAHQAGEEATRRGILEFKKAGDALLKAKEACGHGQWLPWLKKHVKFSARTARRYMRLASAWQDKMATMANLTDALALLAKDDGDAEEADGPEGQLLP